MRVRPAVRLGQTGVLTARAVPRITGAAESALSASSAEGGPAGREAVRRRRATARGASCAGTLGASAAGAWGGSAGGAAGTAPSTADVGCGASGGAGTGAPSSAPGAGVITCSDAVEAPPDPRVRDRDRRPLTVPESLPPGDVPDGGLVGADWFRTLTGSAVTSTPRPLQCSQRVEYASNSPVPTFLRVI